MTTHKNVCSCDLAGGGLCGKIGGREKFGSAKTVKSAELTPASTPVAKESSRLWRLSIISEITVCVLIRRSTQTVFFYQKRRRRQDDTDGGRRSNTAGAIYDK